MARRIDLLFGEGRALGTLPAELEEVKRTDSEIKNDTTVNAEHVKA